MSRFKVLLFSFSALVCSMLVPNANAQWRGSDKPKLVVVNELSYEYETTLIEAVGTAQAKRSVDLFSSVAEEVTSVNFNPGQAVEKGDVLVALDSRLQDIEVTRAEIQLADAKRILDRVSRSQSSGAVTESEVDDATTQVLLAEVALKEAKQNKEDRLIRAPFAGIVGLTDVEVGDRVTEQTLITTLDDRSDLLVSFVAPELAVPFLMSMPEVELQPWTERDLQLSAQIAELDSRVDETNRTIRARAMMTNIDDKYRPGMSFRVSLAVKGERYVAIPEAALSWGATGAYVWLAQGEQAKRVNVNVEQRLRGRILVSGDLDNAQTLIVEGIQGLRDGQALNVQFASDTDVANSSQGTITTVSAGQGAI